MPPAMRTPGSRAMTIGLVIMLLSVSAGMHSDGLGVLLCFMGVLVGANLLAIAVRMDEEPAPIIPVLSRDAQALAAFVHRNAAGVGLVMAFCAVTAVSGEEDPALCLGMFTLLLSGLTLINFAVAGLGE